MSDKPKNEPNKVVKAATKARKLPPQKSPTDTSNWDNRTFTTPSGRVIIETNQNEDGSTVIQE